MKTLGLRGATKSLALTISAAIALVPLATFAQTPIKLHSNKFSPADDVKLGREAAGQAEQKLQLLPDPEIGAYIERVGERLAAAIPQEFQHPEFQYYFKVVNAKEINAFALPGGPMYVNSGMIEAAKTEGEMAGVMAHELSHVALRHGTAQVTKAQKYSMLSNIMGMGGAIMGGPLGQVAQMGAQGVGVYLLKFSREYETEADLLGAHIMANAGYDPRDLANMFKTIESQGGGGGGFLSDHPSAKDRFAKINQEAQSLKVNTAATPDNHDFLVAKQRLTGNTSGRMTGSNQRSPNQTASDSNVRNEATSPGVPSGHAASPSSNYRSYSLGVAEVSVPENWRQLSNEGSSSVWFAPEGGYGSSNGTVVFTHAFNVGIMQGSNGSLEDATNDFLKQLRSGNANLRSRGEYKLTSIDNHKAIAISMSNVNEATNQPEVVNLLTTQLQNGRLLYFIMVAPESDYNNYQGAFQKILQSVRVKG